jgi:hypothetical protein
VHTKRAPDERLHPFNAFNKYTVQCIMQRLYKWKPHTNHGRCHTMTRSDLGYFNPLRRQDITWYDMKLREPQPEAFRYQWNCPQSSPACTAKHEHSALKPLFKWAVWVSHPPQLHRQDHSHR